MEMDDPWEAFEHQLENEPAYRGRSLIGIVIAMSIPAMCIWLWTRHSTGPGCEIFINKVVLILGVLLFLSFVSGLWLCMSPLSFGMCVCEHMTLLIIWGLLGFGIFILAVSSPGGGRSPPPDAGFQEYVLDDYSPWFQKRVNSTPHWNHLKKCIAKENVCHKFFDEYVNDTQDQFFARNLSPMESGCCKPPTNCNFNYTSPLKWTKPKEWNQTNMDCSLWNEDPIVLCFNCQSCKAGFVNDVKESWVIAGIVILVVFCLILYVSPCSSCKGGFYTTMLIAYSMSSMDQMLNNMGGSEKGELEENSSSASSLKITDNDDEGLEAGEESTPATPPLDVTDNNIEELGEEEESTKPPRPLEITDNRLDKMV